MEIDFWSWSGSGMLPLLPIASLSLSLSEGTTVVCGVLLSFLRHQTVSTPFLDLSTFPGRGSSYCLPWKNATSHPKLSSLREFFSLCQDGTWSRKRRMGRSKALEFNCWPIWSITSGFRVWSVQNTLGNIEMLDFKESLGTGPFGISGLFVVKETYMRTSNSLLADKYGMAVGTSAPKTESLGVNPSSAMC